MIVRCIYNSLVGSLLTPSLKTYFEKMWSGELTKIFPLKKEKYYVVYAYAFGPHIPWVYIIDETGSVYPNSYPIQIFDVVDSSVSQFWRIGSYGDWLGGKYSLLAINEWSADSCFHGRLFEGEKDALETLNKYADCILREFPLPWIKDVAVMLSEDGWVCDKDFNDTWKVSDELAMIQSPNTQKLFHNPFYKMRERVTH